MAVLNLAAGFLGIAQMAQTVFGGPFHAGRVIDQAGETYDDGGSIVSPGAPVFRTCVVQIVSIDDRVRPEGWTDKDYRFIILSASLTGTLNTDATVEVLAGTTTPADFVGIWQVSQIELDSVAIGYAGAGRKQ